MTELFTPTVSASLDLTELRRAVTGPVWDPGDVAVVAELAGFNLAPVHEPVGVVGATDAHDVAAAVRWARARDLGVAVVATGHADFSHRGTLIVSTRRLDRCDVDPAARTAVVGAGVKWARVIEAAAPHGLTGVSGSTTDVGVVGFCTGGGVGPMIRRFGLGSDRVRAITVVTGEGAIREVGPGDELFDAMLGGKDAAGIVVEMTVELVEVSRFYGGAIFYDAADAPAVLHAWREWQAGLGENTTTSIAILRMPDLEAAPPPLRGRTVVHLRVWHLGPEIEGLEVLSPMRRVATPIVDMVDELPSAAIDAVHCDPTDPMPSWITGGHLREITAETIDTVLEIAGPQRELPVIIVELRQTGGRGVRGTQGVAARAPYTVGVVAPMVPALAEVVPAVGLGLVDALAAWSTGTVPANYASPETIAARPGACWDDDGRARLAAVVARTDPDGVLGGRRLGLR
ncbi:FAD-binding oxidoreductase [Actinomycetospora sp. NBRC 106378]|uniref:FAD-binding oxidoreductase n=1 Tax=Actinomycetospora sp. NBRC 106378 TaxID=3032208 RepID=UPI0024A37BA0|nr:FAD-binding oxidoreductase [Actinomycetospora sp. NBRC 106378]GLZ54409.1 FAD-linked oxidase [Actinomycetospora sp. NBRC 106378]